jgi:hypothetical protein
VVDLLEKKTLSAGGRQFTLNMSANEAKLLALE